MLTTYPNTAATCVVGSHTHLVVSQHGSEHTSAWGRYPAWLRFVHGSHLAWLEIDHKAFANARAAASAVSDHRTYVTLTPNFEPVVQRSSHEPRCACGEGPCGFEPTDVIGGVRQQYTPKNCSCIQTYCSFEWVQIFVYNCSFLFFRTKNCTCIAEKNPCFFEHFLFIYYRLFVFGKLCFFVPHF